MSLNASVIPCDWPLLATCLWPWQDSSLNLIPAFAYPDTLFDNLNITAYKGQGKTDLVVGLGVYGHLQGLQVEGTVEPLAESQ